MPRMATPFLNGWIRVNQFFRKNGLPAHLFWTIYTNPIATSAENLLNISAAIQDTFHDEVIHRSTPPYVQLPK